MTTMPACAVLGLGNVLMGDDGFGPFATRTFTSVFAPHADVAVIDAGTPGLDLAPYLMDRDAVIVIDTIRLDAPPGTMRIYRKPALLQAPPAQRLGPHDPGLAATLMLLELQGSAPREVVLVGVVPATVATFLGLSETIEATVPAVIDAVAAELARLGRPVMRRAVPAAPDLWWLRRQPDAALSHSTVPAPTAGR